MVTLCHVKLGHVIPLLIFSPVGICQHILAYFWSSPVDFSENLDKAKDR